MRDRIFDALKRTPEDPRGVFERFKNGLEEEAAPQTATAGK